MKTRIYLAAGLLSLSALNTRAQDPWIANINYPMDTNASPGATVSFRVIAGSTNPPMSFQWQHEGTNLFGATNAIMVISNLTVAHAGGYQATVWNASGDSTNSRTAILAVNPTFIKITDGPIVTDLEPTEDSTWWDYNNDNLLDVVVHVGPPHGPGVVQTFFRNDGNFTFTKITTNAVAQTLKRGLIAAVGDVDNDGDQDIYIGSNAWQSNEPKDELFLNYGGGVFAALPNAPWILEQDHTFDCTFVDLDRDGLLDIFVVNYDQPPCLYRQTTAGTFLKMTAAQVGSILANPGHSYNAAWVDYDNDGDQDLWIENYLGSTRLHQNSGTGFFTLATPPSFAQSPGGHGIWADFDNDKFPELFVGGDTETGTRPNALYRGVAGQNFTNVAVQAGVAVTMPAWASAVGDYDNDGWLDIFAAYWFEGTAGASFTNVLFRNRGGGSFEQVDVGSPIRDGPDWRMGVRWVDCNNDGFLDLFITRGGSSGTTEYRRANLLYANNGPAIGNTNHWLKIKLNGQASNRSGIGAKIRVKATIGGQEIWQLREMTGNGYSQTCPGLIAHFGLGDATKADIVRVEWPSGNVQELADVTPDRLLSITEQVFITPMQPSASLNGSVTLARALVAGATYQWRFDGVDLVGQTNRILNLTNIVAGQEGRYSVAVSNETTLVTNYVYLLVDTQFERIVMGDAGASWGCGWGDYNNDGYPDLIVGEGTFTSTKACSLYRNNTDATLTKVTAAEVGPLASLVRNWQSVAWGDYNNDGFLDLIVSDNPASGEPRPALWRNVGDGSFEEATSAASFLTDRLWGNPFWGDFNRDGLLDLGVANAWNNPAAWSRNLLYFNRGDATFRQEAQGGFFAYLANVEGGAAGDMDGDGDLDILLGSHSGVALFENDGAGGFARITAGFPSLAGTAVAPAWTDYDNDGRLDVFVPVHHGDATSSLIHNDGNGQWTRISLGPVSESGGASWADYDNDGDLDLIITRGQSSTATKLFYANNGDGTFTPITLGSLANDVGLWADSAWADYDNNGFQDLFVTSHGGYPEVLYRNHGNSNHWIMFKLIGTRSNRSAIGAKVRVQANIFVKNVTQMREIGGGNRSQSDLRPHFGLGNATTVSQLRVEWPSGIKEDFQNLAVNRMLTLVEPSLRGAMLPNGMFELSVTGSTNRVCQVEYSTNLVDWTSLTNVTGQGETPVKVTDPDAPTHNQRFYRMK